MSSVEQSRMAEQQMQYLTMLEGVMEHCADACNTEAVWGMLASSNATKVRALTVKMLARYYNNVKLCKCCAGPFKFIIEHVDILEQVVEDVRLHDIAAGLATADVGRVAVLIRIVNLVAYVLYGMLAFGRLDYENNVKCSKADGKSKANVKCNKADAKAKVDVKAKVKSLVAVLRESIALPLWRHVVAAWERPQAAASDLKTLFFVMARVQKFTKDCANGTLFMAQLLTLARSCVTPTEAGSMARWLVMLVSENMTYYTSPNELAESWGRLSARIDVDWSGIAEVMCVDPPRDIYPHGVEAIGEYVAFRRNNVQYDMTVDDDTDSKEEEEDEEDDDGKTENQTTNLTYFSKAAFAFAPVPALRDVTMRRIPRIIDACAQLRDCVKTIMGVLHDLTFVVESSSSLTEPLMDALVDHGFIPHVLHPLAAKGSALKSAQRQDLLWDIVLLSHAHAGFRTALLDADMQQLLLQQQDQTKQQLPPIYDCIKALMKGVAWDSDAERDEVDALCRAMMDYMMCECGACGRTRVEHAMFGEAMCA